MFQRLKGKIKQQKDASKAHFYTYDKYVNKALFFRDHTVIIQKKTFLNDKYLTQNSDYLRSA